MILYGILIAVLFQTHIMVVGVGIGCLLDILVLSGKKGIGGLNKKKHYRDRHCRNQFCFYDPGTTSAR